MTTRIFTIVALVTLGLVAAACDSKRPAEPQTTSQPLTKNETTAATTESSANPAKEELVLEVDHHPFPMEHHRLELRLTEDAEFAFHAAPDGAAEVAKRQKFKAGEPIEFTESRTRVPSPVVLQTRKEVTVDGMPIEGGDTISQTLAAGDEYSVFLYAGEGTCYVAINGRLAIGTCPDKERFQTEGWSGNAPVPDSLEWWVKTRHGWLQADLDKLERKQVSTL